MISLAFPVFFLVFANISVVHSMGLWVCLMILHGPLVHYLGVNVIHAPLYAGLAITLVIGVKGKWSSLPVDKVFIIFFLILLMCISSFLGINQAVSLPTIINYSKGFLLAILLVMIIRDGKEIKVLTLYCIAALTVGSLMTVYKYKTGDFSIQSDWVNRVASLRGDPNDSAMLFLSGLPLTVYWIRSSKAWFSSWFFFFCFLLLVVSILMTGSRGGFVALLPVLFAIYLKNISIKSSIVAVFFLVAGVLFAPHGYWERMETIASGKEVHGGASITNRIKMLSVGTSIVLNSPVFGVGPGNFGQAFMGKITAGKLAGSGSGSRGQFKKGVVAHNMYLDFFSENGIIGGFTFLSIFIVALFSLRRLDLVRGAGGLLSRDFGLGFAISLSLLGMLFAGLFLSQGKNSVLWFITGLGLAAGGVVRENRPWRS